MTNLVQTVTYWAPNAIAGAYDLFDCVASPFQPPQHFKVVEMFGDDSGVISVGVEDEHSLERFGYIFLGVSNSEDPRKVYGAKEIKDLGSKPDLRTLKQLTVAYFD